MEVHNPKQVSGNFLMSYSAIKVLEFNHLMLNSVFLARSPKTGSSSHNSLREILEDWNDKCSSENESPCSRSSVIGEGDRLRKIWAIVQKQLANFIHYPSIERRPSYPYNDIVPILRTKMILIFLIPPEEIDLFQFPNVRLLDDF